MKTNRQSEDKKNTRAVAMAALVAAFTFTLQGCNEQVPVSDFGPAPSVRVPVEELDAETKELVILGGRLYDNWIAISGVIKSDNNPMAVYIKGYSEASPTKPYSDFIVLDGTDTTKPKPKQYRCNTCHGFNYTGSEFFLVGVMDASANKTIEEIQAIISDGISFTIGTTEKTVHQFGGDLSSAEIKALATFIKHGVVNIGDYLYTLGSVGIGKGNAGNGKTLYFGNAGCSASTCHGPEGKGKDFGGGEVVGTIGQNDPDEMLHKIRFGQPSSPRRGGMPSIYDSHLTTQDAADIMTFTQQLPK